MANAGSGVVENIHLQYAYAAQSGLIIFHKEQVLHDFTVNNTFNARGSTLSRECTEGSKLADKVALAHPG